MKLLKIGGQSDCGTGKAVDRAEESYKDALEILKKRILSLETRLKATTS